MEASQGSDGSLIYKIMTEAQRHYGPDSQCITSLLLLPFPFAFALAFTFPHMVPQLSQLDFGLRELGRRDGIESKSTNGQRLTGQLVP